MGQPVLPAASSLKLSEHSGVSEPRRSRSGFVVSHKPVGPGFRNTRYLSRAHSEHLNESGIAAVELIESPK